MLPYLRRLLAAASLLGVSRAIDVPVAGGACSWQHTPICNMSVRHTCEHLSDVAHSCPPLCPFVVKDQFFACSVTCVARDDCAQGDVRKTYANNTQKTCERGGIPACVQYNVSKHCVHCAKMFQLIDNQCIFTMEGFEILLKVTVVILIVALALIIPLLIWRSFKPKGKPSAVRIGWEHSARCLPGHDVFENHSGVFASWTKDMCKDPFLAGPGLCLYYNNLWFIGLIALLCFIATCIPYYATSLTDEWNLDKKECHLNNDGEVKGLLYRVNEYASLNAICLGVLWLITFILSLWHVYRQAELWSDLDEHNDTMADYAARLTGFPKDATEEEIIEFVNGIDDHVVDDKGDTTTLGVSCAYDYETDREFIDAVLDLHIQKCDVAAGTYEEIDDDSDDELQANDPSKVREVLEGLQMSGTAFAIFRTEEEKEQFIEYWDDDSYDTVFRGEYEIDCKSVRGEPTSVQWWSQGFSIQRRVRNCIKEAAILLVITIALALLVYWPTASYMLTFMRSTGEMTGDYIAQELGILCALINIILTGLVDSAGLRIGFRLKAHIDIWNFSGALILVVADTIFNFWLTIHSVTAIDMVVPHSVRGDVDDALPGRGYDEMKIRNAGKHLYMADKLWWLLVPMTIVTPFILNVILNYWINLPAYIAYLLPIPWVAKDVRSDEKMTPRLAEKSLEPQPVQIQYDYGNNIYLFLCVFPLLFLETNKAHWGCLVILWFVVWTYFTNKWSHLFWTKTVLFTVPDLDTLVNYCWGVPLSMLLAASGHWAQKEANGMGILSRDDPLVPVLLFTASLLSYFVLLMFVKQFGTTAFGKDSALKKYEVVADRLHYTWFNCNPIHVLRQLYLGGDGSIVYYQQGKAYLQKTHPEFDEESAAEGQLTSGGYSQS